MKYTSCCASPGSPVYQFRKLVMGLKSSPAHFAALMNEILVELPEDVRDYISCIMDDVLIFSPTVEIHFKVLKAFLYKLKEHGMLLTVNKVLTFRNSVKYMGLNMSSVDGTPTITPLGSI